MIGDFEMMWTAICLKNGLTCAVNFHSINDAPDALKDIQAVMRGDGYEVLALLKGNQTSNFYGIEVSTEKIIPNQEKHKNNVV